ncbi:MAG: lysophospholipid acyltransferase family protein [Acidimicrobiia bacterium]
MSRSGADGRPTVGQRLLYRLVRGAVVCFCRAFWRLSVTGREHVPDGPFILAPVHRSNIDTPVVAAVTRRRLRYMGKDSLWKFRWSAWFFRNMGGFPVHRGTPDREALRWASSVVAGGEPVVMFPEGTRQEGPIVEHVLDGVAFVALREGVPILPVGIGGSDRAMARGARLPRPVRVTMVIGPPIPATAPGAGERVPRRAVRELTVRLRDELQLLYDEAQARAGR